MITWLFRICYGLGYNLDHLQKSWLINEAVRAQIVMELHEIAIQRAQGVEDSRGQVYMDRVLDRTLNVKCKYTLL